jgi:hypothetical protein
VSAASTAGVVWPHQCQSGRLEPEAPLPVEPLLAGGRFGPALRYGPLRLLGTANGARWHRVCAGRVLICTKATYRARQA